MVRMARYLIPKPLRSGPTPLTLHFRVREEDLIHLDLVDHYEETSDEEGVVNTHAGPESWEAFVNQAKDEEMEFLVRSLAETFELGDFIRRRELHAYHKLCRLLDALLYLVARGNLVYDIDSHRWVYAKPVIAPPPPEMRQRILDRIRVSRDLQFTTIGELTNLELPTSPKETIIQ